MPGELATREVGEPAADSPRYRRGPSGLLAWLLVAIAAVGLLAATPPSAGPDEPAHQVAAWYTSGHLLPPAPGQVFAVPDSLYVAACYAFHPDVTAACMPARSDTGFWVTASTIVNYPPPYYWVVGTGERLAAVFGLQYADIGGRLASLVLNLGVLLLLSLYMRRRHSGWGDILLLVSTPMAVFLGVVVNPSGWEVTCGIAFAVLLAEAAWAHRPSGSDDPSGSTLALLAVAGIGLCTARPISFVWAAGLTAAALVLAPSMSRRTSLRVAFAVAPGILIGVIWALLHPDPLPVHSTVPTPTTIPNFANFFAESLLWFPNRLHQMFGLLGWFDTPEPDLLVLANIVAWTAVLTRLPNIRRTAILGGVFGIVILPSLIEALGWGVYPLWRQGRYTLPFALGFLVLLLLRSGRLIPRTISIASGVAVLSLGVMVWVNAARYDFGLNIFYLPANSRHQGLSPVQLDVALLAGALLVLISVVLLVRAWLNAPDDARAAEPGRRPAANGN